MKKVVISLLIGVILAVMSSMLILRDTEIQSYCFNDYEVSSYGFPAITETKAELITDPQNICNALLLEPAPTNETHYIGYLINSLIYSALAYVPVSLFSNRKRKSS